MLDRVLAIAPDFAGARIQKAVVHEAWKGETSLAKEVLREASGRPLRGPVGAPQDWIVHLLWHNPSEALSLLDSVDSDSIIGSFVFPKAFL